MPVQSIERIEVIRGPGSAIYGADAFAGVINIITKTKENINGTKLGSRAGSFDTYDGWALHGDTWGGVDVAAIFEIHNTHGQRQIIGADAQTYLDGLYGTQASLAPGPVNLQRDNIDARVDISKENWRFRGGLQHRENGGTGAGVAQALDPQGRFGSDRWNADLTYHNPEATENWDVTAQLSYFNTSQAVEQNILLYPPGAFGGTFPDGVIGNPNLSERHARANLSAFYSGFDDHKVRIGTGINYSSIYNIREYKNFRLVPAIPQPIPLAGLTNVSNDPDAVFLSPGNREDYFIFLQDEWRFAKDWELTTGLRYDYYSDFGSTVNPRLALVWETRHDLTTKFLYGRAFRAPSFAEMRLMNNPVNEGNRDLSPETINTIELAFDYRPDDKLRLGLNLFNYWWSDIIQFQQDSGATTRTAQNTGSQTGYGLELEADWKIAASFRLTGNYSYQHSTDDATNRSSGYAPQDKVYLRADWEFLPEWHMNPQLDWIIDRQRVADDPRPPVSNYLWADFTLRRKNLLDHWEIAFSVRNLFNTDAREPSPAGVPGIPNDLPLAPRYYYGEIRFSF
jgi:outer membrane receptor protein involved in Fe transport